MIALPRLRYLVFAAPFAFLLSLSVQASETQLQEAVDRVQQETHGKVLSVQTMQLGKRKIYRIKVLTPEGQVRVIQIKADE